MRILVVDDSRTMRTHIRSTLEKAGYAVDEAEDGRDALAKVILAKQPYDLITLDIVMPGMNGFATCEKLLAMFRSSQSKPIPIVFLTSNDSLEDRTRGFELGATNFVHKSFLETELVPAVNRILCNDGSMKGLVALVVDDSKTYRKIIADTLLPLGVKVDEAEDGQAALTMIKKNPSRYNLITTDQEMPVMDGLELTSRIHDHLGLRDIPILVISSHDDALSKIALFKSGAADYVIKPFIQEELISRIHARLEAVFLNKELRKGVRRLQNANKELRTSKKEIEKYRDHLEELVQEKTRSLSLALEEREAEIAARKRMEKELLIAKEKAEEASKTKSEFLANMSHELRTPLNGLLGLLQILQEEPLNDSQQEYLETSLHLGRNLGQLIKDILDFSKAEAGDLCLEPNEFDPASLLNTMLELYKPEARTKNINLYCTLDKNIPYSLYGDENRIRQVLFNLIGNALKFTDQGEVHVNLKTETKGGKGQGIDLVCTVSDTGIGIPPEKMDIIFQPFRQVDGAYTRKHGGAGLGLAIVKHLVDLIGGKIEVESKAGAGTTVRVQLPMARHGAADVPRTTLPSGAPLAPDNFLAQNIPACGLVSRRMPGKKGTP